MCRVALQEARKHGASVVAEVSKRVRAYFAAKADAACSGFEMDCGDALPSIAAAVVKELNEASTAMARVAADPSPANRHAARLEIAEGHDALLMASRTVMSAQQRTA